MVRPKNVPLLKDALVLLLKKEPQFKHLQDKLEDHEWRQLMELLFKGKRLFPSPDQLRMVGFQDVLEFDLCAGDCLFAKGGCAHWGLNQHEDTASLAANMLTESWLTVGHCKERDG